MIWAVVATVTDHTDPDRGVASLQVPTFFLDADVQGIVDAKHAEKIAEKIINPTTNPKIEVHAHAAPALFVTKQD